MKIQLFLSIFFLSYIAKAVCPEPLKSGFEAYQCIVEQNPSIQALKYRSEEIQAMTDKASQFSNPELDAGIETSGEKKLELSILQPIELGGKRGARAEKVQAEITFMSAKDSEARIEASNTALESLIRLRQLKLEIALVRDSLTVLERINHRLKSRPALSPEQKTALRLFSTFEKTLRFRQVNVIKESSKNSAFIEASIGRSLTKNDQVSVGTFKKWPILDAGKINGQTAVLRSSLAELEILKSEVNLAQSESWPDIRIGPSIERRPDENETSWGVKLSATLPIWNTNESGRNLAKARLNSTNAALESTKRQQTSQSDLIQKQYVDLTKVLSETDPTDKIIVSIKETEKLFDRALISPSSLIETYRSTFELIEEVHRNEIQAMLIWSTVENLKGTAPKELP